ncbi:MAG: bacteriohemerythrin [Phycisphaerae bacterium]
MARTWTPDLAVGNAQIDAQHKELFLRVNRLLDAMKAGQAATELPALLDFLGKYVVAHFNGEEALMKQFNYPNAAHHHRLHLEFLQRFQTYQTQFAAKGPATSLLLQFQKEATDWLVTHISKTDKELGAFLQQKQAA